MPLIFSIKTALTMGYCFASRITDFKLLLQTDESPSNYLILLKHLGVTTHCPLAFSESESTAVQ
ncbi:hypothetical protein ACTXT7_004065 [Hymenolepis weldensis]